MYSYPGMNRRPFSSICQCNFGRKVIYTYENRIDKDNIIAELNKALAIHNQNAMEIEYLDRYYRGDQPIIYRQKKTRPEINNKIVINLAQYLVDTKASEIAGEPIQYVLRGTDARKSDEINSLNTMLINEDKDMLDIELCRWRSICGTAYRYIGLDNGTGSILDESVFYIDVPDPRLNFVVYYANSKKPAFSCTIGKDQKGRDKYYCYTNAQYFDIENGEIKSTAINGRRAIPLIEYPNNERRLSDIEITISLTDAINKLTSDRINGVEQFVQAFIKFVNCDIDNDKFEKLRESGAFVVKSNNGDNKADVDILSSELSQSEGQVVMSDLFEKFLIVHGIASREGKSDGGSTAGAVLLRDGYYTQEKRSELSEPIFKKSEKALVRILLHILKVEKQFTLMPSDIEIKITRSKRDNMLTKAQTMQLLMQSGIEPTRAIKTVGLFSDPEQVAKESQERLAVVYPNKPQTQETQSNATTTSVTNVVDNISNV